MEYGFSHKGNNFRVVVIDCEATFYINEVSCTVDDQNIVDAVMEFDGDSSLQEIPGWDMLISDACELMSEKSLRICDEDLTLLKEVGNQRQDISNPLAQMFIAAGYSADDLCDITGLESVGESS